MPDSLTMPAPNATPVKTPDTPAKKSGWAGRVWRGGALFWLSALAIYWLSLFAGTHSEARDIPTGIWNYDKLLHAGAYFGLTTLVLIAARRFGSLSTGKTYVKAAALVLAYGAFDELTQPFFGRQCELFDWLADAAGVLAAVGVDRWRHRSTNQNSTPAQ